MLGILNDRENDFRMLLDRNSDRWLGIAKAYAAKGEREDLFQEMLMQIWKSLARHEGRSSLDTWAYRVALNTALTWKRGTRNRHFAKNAITFELDQMPGDTGSQTREAKMLNEFLASLSKKDRAIMLLFLDAIPNQEAAEIMGITEGALRVRLHRIRKQFEASFCE
ncbi:sigma-70 family RNA polymerase sigma factor [Mariniblastus sp.]|nr:sigma-70 family RNA polymerase sigma factor [Mariniblastus sp.]